MFEELFKKLLEAEQNEFSIKKDAQRIIFDNQIKVSEAEKLVREIWQEIENKMQDSKLDKVWVKGEHTNYVISYSKAREIVEVGDIDALPDQFVRIKKEPKKKELLEFLQQCHESNNPFPNYATIKLGESKLNWRAVKMGNEEAA